MSVVQTSIEIDASVDQVWDVVADPNNLPLWDRHIDRVSGLPNGALRPGTEYEVRLRFMGARATVPARVLEIKPGEYAKVQLGGLIEATVETWLEPLGGRRTRLRHRIQYRFRGGPLGALGARAINLLGAPMLLRRGALAQKRQIEGSRR